MNVNALKTPSWKWRRLKQPSFQIHWPLSMRWVYRRKVGPVYRRIVHPHHMRRAFHHYREYVNR